MNTDRTGPEGDVKFKSVMSNRSMSSFQKYRHMYYGDMPLSEIVLCEFVVMVSCAVPGGFGLWLRSKLYPLIFKSIGFGVIFGRNVTVRHPHKISIGDNVVIDDNAVLDAKGDTNNGIVIGSNVYIGRNTIIYCKNGDITLGNKVTLSANCTVYSNNVLRIGDGTVVGAYSYLLSGGEYDYNNPDEFYEQSGMGSKGRLDVGANCWLGARVTVLDAACVGDHSVIGAGAVVAKSIPANSLAVGVPARVIRHI